MHEAEPPPELCVVLTGICDTGSLGPTQDTGLGDRGCPPVFALRRSVLAKFS